VGTFFSLYLFIIIICLLYIYHRCFCSSLHTNLFSPPLFISTSKREEHSPKQNKKNPGNSGKFPLYGAASWGGVESYFGIIYFLILGKKT